MNRKKKTYKYINHIALGNNKPSNEYLKNNNKEYKYDKINVINKTEYGNKEPIKILNNNYNIKESPQKNIMSLNNDISSNKDVSIESNWLNCNMKNNYTPILDKNNKFGIDNKLVNIYKSYYEANVAKSLDKATKGNKLLKDHIESNVATALQPPSPGNSNIRRSSRILKHTKEIRKSFKDELEPIDRKSVV